MFGGNQLNRSSKGGEALDIRPKDQTFGEENGGRRSSPLGRLYHRWGLIQCLKALGIGRLVYSNGPREALWVRDQRAGCNMMAAAPARGTG